MARPIVYIDLHLLLQREGSILMGKRLNTRFGAGQYHVPAGHLESDETIIDGIIREAFEEIGIGVMAEDLKLAYVMHFRGASDRLSLFFTADRWSGAIENREPDKCAGWEWISPQDLPENTIPYAKHALADILAGKRLGLFGWSDP